MRLLSLSPALFWAALAAATAGAVALHFLRIRSPRVIVPTLLFWRQALREQVPAVLFRRLARLPTLLLVLAALWALLAAAADPAAGEAPHEVVLLDPALLEDGASRAEAAARLEELARSRRGVRRALVVAGRPSRALAVFSDPDTGLARLLQGAAAEGGPAFWPDALVAARDLLAGRSAPGVRILLQDPAEVPADAAALCGVPPRLECLGAPLWDDGVAAASPVLEASGGASVLLRAERKGRGGPVRRLVVRQDGVEVQAPLLADQTGPALVALSGLPPGTRIEAALTGQDARPGNDRLALAVPPARRLRVFAADAGPVLEALLEALPGVERVQEPIRGAVAVTRTGAGEERCRQLPALCFRADEGLEGGRAPLMPASAHGLVAGLAFAGVRARAREPQPAGGLLLGAGGGAAAWLDLNTPNRIFFGLDPEDRASGLAECADFPRFVARALAGLAGEPGESEALEAGRWTAAAAGLGGAVIALVHEGGTAMGVALRDGRGEWLPARPGAYTLAGRPGPQAPGGGPPRARPPDAPVEEPGAEESGPSLGALLCLLGLGVLLVEWWALHRGRVA